MCIDKKNVLKLFVALIIVCAMLCGCGKSEAVKNVEQLINEIGEVTVDSEESINKAEEAYNALTDKEKEQVENADQISTKKEEYQACVKKAEEDKRKAMLEPFLGTWVPLYADALAAIDDSAYTSELEIVDYYDNIEVVDEESIKVGRKELGTLKLIEDEDGIKKLVCSKCVFVRKEDYSSIYDKMFVHVKLNEDNIGDYIGGPVIIGKFLDTWKDETDSDVYIFSSPAYEEGLLMLSFKNVKFEMDFKGHEDPSTFGEPYPIMWGWGEPELDHFGRGQGEIWYARKEYVSNIKKDMQVMSTRREITFKDGFSGRFYAPSNIEKINVELEDIEY